MNEMPVVRPETYRLPTKGGDPFFGFSRSWYYGAESRGCFKLIRIRDRGKKRGVVLARYTDILGFVNRAASEQAEPQSAAAAS
jgi:hypothetical protein